MKARSLLVLAAVAAIGVVLWIAFRAPQPTEPSDLITIDVPRAEAPVTRPDEDLASVGPAARTEDRTAGDVEVAVLSTSVIDDDHPWAGMLAGVKGRLIEEDGTPVPDMRVELIEADLSVLFQPEKTALGNEEPEIAEAFTDDEGRFFMDGARDGAFHALNIDRGGGRATIRLVEQSVEHGAVTDLGDIVMDAYGTIIGTVIDEDGEPVGGARVRATVVPEIAMQTGILDVRKGVVITARDAEGQAFELPPYAFTLLDRLPVPTTVTAGDGTFRLEGVPLGSVSGGADKEGHVAGIIGPINLTATEVDVGEIELLYGRIVSGTVTDELDEPVAGVEVCVGAIHPIFTVALMQRASVTNELGQYEIQGIPEDGTLVGAVRRHRSEPWQVQQADGGGDTIDFVLPAALRLTCRVLDEAGDPVEDAEVSVRPSAEAGNEMAWITNMAMTGRQPMAQTRAKQTAPGTYVVEDLKLGQWMVEAKAPGRAIVRGQVEVAPEKGEIELVAPTGRTVRVVVTDAITGLPVARAHASLLGPEGFLMTAFASGFTDVEGATKLGPLHPSWHKEATDSAVWLKEIIVSVEHPRYGMAKAKVSDDATEVRVELPPACTVQGRVSWAGASPLNLYMVMLRWKDDNDAMAQATMLPRTALTNLEGNFRITGLAPGEYEMYVMERYFDGNPIKLIVDQKEPKMIDRRDVAAAPEEPTFVDIELSPDGQGPSGRFAGRLTVDGNPLVGAKVEIGNREPEVLFTDSGGEFESEAYSVLQGVRVKINGEVPLPDGSTEPRELYNSWSRPKADEVTRIDLDLAYTYLTVQTFDKDSGLTLSDVRVRLDGGMELRRRGRDDGGVKTDSSGLAQVLLSDNDSHSLTASRDGYAPATVQVSSKTAKQEGPLRIEIEPQVVCSGRVVLPPDMEPSQRMFLHVKDSGSEDWARIDTEDLTFEFKGLGPGEYKVEMWGGPGRGMTQASFLLPEGGDTNVLIDFSVPPPQGGD